MPTPHLKLALAGLVLALCGGSASQQEGQVPGSLEVASARALLQVSLPGGTRAPFGTTPANLCLAVCHSSTVTTSALVCPSGYSASAVVNGVIQRCWRNCPSPYTPGPPPGGNPSDPPSWCQIDTQRCPSGWVLYGTDDTTDNAITCRKECPAGYEYLQPRNARRGCYKTCDAGRTPVDVLSDNLRQRLMLCCAACPKGTTVGPTAIQCQPAASIQPQPRDCVTRKFLSATIQTFAPYQRQVAAPVCTTGKPFTVGGVRQCYTCSAGTPHQLPSGAVVCLGCSCPSTHTWAAQWYCLINNRIDDYLFSKLDPKTMGLFLDNLQILKCLPACPPPPPVLQPSALSTGKR